jgi:integrase
MPGCKPLTDRQQEEILRSFKGPCKRRNIALFIFGCNCGYRGGKEIPSLCIGDVIGSDGKMFDTVTIQKKYRKKKQRSHSVPLNSITKDALKYWIEELNAWGFNQPDDYVFCKRNGEALKYHAIWKILTQGIRNAGLSFKRYEKGTHMMRKTCANNAFDDGLERLSRGEKINPLTLVMQILGHEDSKSTLSYLSFRESEVEQTIENIGRHTRWQRPD